MPYSIKNITYANMIEQYLKMRIAREHANTQFWGSAHDLSRGSLRIPEPARRSLKLECSWRLSTKEDVLEERKVSAERPEWLI